MLVIALFAFFSISWVPSDGQLLHTLRFKTVQDTKAYFHYTGDGFVIISGHRGGALPGYPENCISTFCHTLSRTSAMFEIDPRLTRDSGIVLVHDASLDRVTTGGGKLNAQTEAEVLKLYLKDADGRPTSNHLNTLDQAIRWSKGKTIINLDVKDVPPGMKARMVKKQHAFCHVIFTVHNAKEAVFFYDFDHRSLFSAWILNEKALEAYQDAGIPWSNFLIAYMGSKFTPENKALTKKLHKLGVMVMIGVGPSDDKLPDAASRAEAYREVVKQGADIIESDRPIEVAKAVAQYYPKKSPKYKYRGRSITLPDNAKTASQVPTEKTAVPQGGGPISVL